MFGAILGGVLGGLGQASAARSANKISAAALAQQKAQQERVWGAVDPYMRGGAEAFGRLSDPEAFKTSPGYDFRLNQGIEGVAQSKAVNGLLRSGGAMKAVSDYAGNMASDEYNRWFGQQQAIAGMGLQGAGIGAGVANANSAAIGTDATNRANAGFAGANAWSGIAGQLGGAFDRMSSYR